jgi:hypothetical protein
LAVSDSIQKISPTTYRQISDIEKKRAKDRRLTRKQRERAKKLSKEYAEKAETEKQPRKVSDSKVLTDKDIEDLPPGTALVVGEKGKEMSMSREAYLEQRKVEQYEPSGLSRRYHDTPYGHIRTEKQEQKAIDSKAERIYKEMSPGEKFITHWGVATVSPKGFEYMVSAVGIGEKTPEQVVKEQISDYGRAGKIERRVLSGMVGAFSSPAGVVSVSQLGGYAVPQVLAHAGRAAVPLKGALAAAGFGIAGYEAQMAKMEIERGEKTKGYARAARLGTALVSFSYGTKIGQKVAFKKGLIKNIDKLYRERIEAPGRQFARTKTTGIREPRAIYDKRFFYDPEKDVFLMRQTVKVGKQTAVRIKQISTSKKLPKKFSVTLSKKGTARLRPQYATQKYESPYPVNIMPQVPHAVPMVIPGFVVSDLVGMRANTSTRTVQKTRTMSKNMMDQVARVDSKYDNMTQTFYDTTARTDTGTTTGFVPVYDTTTKKPRRPRPPEPQFDDSVVPLGVPGVEFPRMKIKKKSPAWLKEYYGLKTHPIISEKEIRKMFGGKI